MVNFDFSPFYRSSVGFDNLFSLLDTTRRFDQEQNGYPPYNIERAGDDKYRITMAVAGFDQNELNVEIKENTLTVEGNKQKASSDANRPQYLYQGIAERNFKRRFQLADHVQVVNAKLEHGLLHIDLVREIPEAMKPRTIQILNGSGKKLLEGEKAA